MYEVNSEAPVAWYLCGRCGVLSFGHPTCRPCRAKILTLPVHPLSDVQARSGVVVLAGALYAVVKNMCARVEARCLASFSSS